MGAVTHGHTVGNASPEYRTWRAIKERCLSPGHPGFSKYGARGVTVCDRWRESFEAFLADVGPKPSATHSIDRIDNSKGYEPGNCRWATRIEQASNRRCVRRVTVHGETATIAEWSRRSGVNHTTIAKRLRQGWSEDDLLKSVEFGHARGALARTKHGRRRRKA